LLLARCNGISVPSVARGISHEKVQEKPQRNAYATNIKAYGDLFLHQYFPYLLIALAALAVNPYFFSKNGLSKS